MKKIEAIRQKLIEQGKNEAEADKLLITAPLTSDPFNDIVQLFCELY